MRSALNKRLDAVEQNLGQGVYVVVFRGIPPYFVLEQNPGNQGKRTEPLLIDTPEELEVYLNSLPKSAKVVQIVCEVEGEPTFLSSEMYSWGQ